MDMERTGRCFVAGMHMALCLLHLIVWTEDWMVVSGASVEA
jgi:hypothetical protein